LLNKFIKKGKPGYPEKNPNLSGLKTINRTPMLERKPSRLGEK